MAMANKWHAMHWNTSVEVSWNQQKCILVCHLFTKITNSVVWLLLFLLLFGMFAHIPLHKWQSVQKEWLFPFISLILQNHFYSMATSAQVNQYVKSTLMSMTMAQDIPAMSPCVKLSARAETSECFVPNWNVIVSPRRHVTANKTSSRSHLYANIAEEH